MNQNGSVTQEVLSGWQQLLEHPVRMGILLGVLIVGIFLNGVPFSRGGAPSTFIQSSWTGGVRASEITGGNSSTTYASVTNLTAAANVQLTSSGGSRTHTTQADFDGTKTGTTVLSGGSVVLDGDTSWVNKSFPAGVTLGDGATMAAAPCSNNAGVSNCLYVFIGGLSKTLLKYDTITASFPAAQPPSFGVGSNTNPVGVTLGATMTYVRVGNNDFIYASNGGGNLYRYLIGGSTWEKMKNPNRQVSRGGSYVWNQGTKIYHISGGNTNNFEVYNTATDNWSNLTGPGGGLLIPDGSTAAFNPIDGYLYVALGGTQRVYRYNQSVWDSGYATAPHVFNVGSSMAVADNFSGGNPSKLVFTLSGGTASTSNALAMRNASQTWVSAGPVLGASNGGALAYTSSARTFFAFKGTGATTFQQLKVVPSSATYTSKSIDFGAPQAYTTVNLDITGTGVTTTFEIQGSIDNTSWTAYKNIPLAAGISGSIAVTETQGYRYLRYRITLTPDLTTTITPAFEVQRVALNYAGYQLAGSLVSTPYKMGVATDAPAIKSIAWLESIPAASASRVGLQLRTKAGATFGSDEWYGPTNESGQIFYSTDPSCQRNASGAAYRVTCTVQPSSRLNDTGVTHFQYNLLLESDGKTTPTVTSVEVTYGTNSSPTVTVKSASQDSSGTFTVEYTVTDDDESAFDVGLFYDRGITLLGQTDAASGVITVASETSLAAIMPNEGVIAIGDEQIVYEGISGNSFLTSESNRGSFQTTPAEHAKDEIVWIRAADQQMSNRGLNVIVAATGNVGASGALCAKQTTCTKSISWVPKTDVVGEAYASSSNMLRVLINDIQATRNVGSAELASSITLDTKAPVLVADSITLVGSSVSTTTTGFKTNSQNVLLAILPPDSTGDNSASLNKYSICVDTPSNQTCGTPLASVLRSGSLLWSQAVSFSTNTSCPGGADAGAGCRAWTLPTTGYVTIHMAAIDDVGNIRGKREKSIMVDKTAPPSIAQFAGQDASNNSVGKLIYLSWQALQASAVQDASGGSDFTEFQIYRNNLSGCATPATFCLLTTLTSLNATSHADSNNLDANTSYQYKILATDNIGNVSSTLAAAPTTAPITPNPTGLEVPPPPVISSAQVVSFSTNSAVISWSTGTTDADASVVYAASQTAPVLPNGYDAYPTQGDVKFSSGIHTKTLVGLSASTKYFIQVRSSTPGNTTPGVYPAAASDPVLTFTTDAPAILERPVITPGSPMASATEHGATFRWTTDVAADSFVEYGPTQSLGNYFGTRDVSTGHEVTISSLEPSTTYYYRLRSTIPGKGERAYPSTSPDTEVAPAEFVTSAATNDTVAPEPKTIRVTDIADTTAVINWHTDERAVQYVEFWTTVDETTKRTLPATPGADETDPSILLSGLDPSTDYQFVAVARDAAGNIGRSSVQPVFHTDSDPRYTTDPQVTTVSNDPPTPTTATIYFTTDQASKITIRYSTENDAPYSRSQIFPGFSQGERGVTLLGLSPNTPYVYKVIAENPSGRTGEGNDCGSGVNSCQFVTSSQGGTLPDIIVSSVVVTKNPDKPNEVTISWRSSAAGNSLVEFGQDIVDGVPQYGRTFGFVRDNTTVHSVTLPDDLLEGQTYYFRLYTRDAAGQLAVFPVTADASDTTCSNPNPAPSTCKNPNFTTLDTGLVQIGEVRTPPKITGVGTLLVTHTKVVVGWTTDKPATSEVFLATSSNFGAEATATDTALTTVHALTIDALTPSTTYYFMVASTDRNDQRFPDDNNGAGYSFKTNAGILAGEGDNNQDQGQLKTDSTTPIISLVQVSNIEDHAATITWNTDEAATSIVQYGATTSYGDIAGDSTSLLTGHTVLLSSLISGTLYHFAVLGYDNAGNRALSADYTFTTTGEPGKLPPEEKLDDKEGEGEKKDEDAVDEEGKDELSEVEKRIRELSEDKQLSLERVIEILKDFDESDALSILDAVGLQLVAPPKFVGGAPQITVTTSSATIRWQTDKEADSRIAFAPSDIFGKNIEQPYEAEIGNSELFTKDHEVTLNNLESNTVYHYQIRSREQVGKTARSQDRTFKTLPLAPEIVRLNISTVTENSITLSWKTNVPTKTEIEYTNVAQSEKRSQGDPQFTTNHQFTVNNLLGDTEYSLIVRAEDETGVKVVSKPLRTKTGRDEIPPVITNVRTEVNLAGEDGASAQAIVTWRTDESATSQVLYEEGALTRDEFGQRTEAGTERESLHVVVLSNLRPATVYRYRALSIDASGNESVSKDFTLLTPQRKQSVLNLIVNNFEQTFGFLQFLGWSE
ncbi:MAG: fibronectin type III domain-containing protein [Patescibacteria group bacterium]